MAPEPFLTSEHYLSRLNPEQREATEHFEGPLLVLAGAGSGKTRVLTTRIAHLVEEWGVAPERILALTFTNKAAGEMRERIRGLLGREPAGMWIGTFHAIGARLLRRDATRLGWSPSFLIYDSDDSERLIRRIVKDELNLDPKKWSPKAIRAAISSAKNELVSVQQYAETAFEPFARRVAEVYERYQRALRDANAFDFDDLLVWPVELFRSHPDVLRRYRERFQFILVDEYQDTNHAQYVFLKLLAGEHTNLFVVGDDDQCLVEGTLVTMADGSRRPIEEIAPGDLVLSGYGSGDFRPARVAQVFRRQRSGAGIAITTRQGRQLVSTPEHTHFAGFRGGQPLPRFRDAGSPVATVTLCGSTRGGMPVHCLSAMAPLAGVQPGSLGLAIQGPPSPSPSPSRGQGRTAAPERIPRTAGFPLSQDWEKALGGEGLVGTGTGDSFAASLDLLALDVEPNSQSWRYETATEDFGKLTETLERIRGGLDINVIFQARLGPNSAGAREANSLPFIPAASVMPGMAVFAEDGSYDIVQTVEKVELDATVYDLNVEGTHNFIANGIVTHNSIYGWRGADIRNILDFEKDFQDARLVRLEENYRSTQTILNAANRVIAQNVMRKGKTLRTANPTGERLVLVETADEADESEWIVSEIRARMRDDPELSPRDFVVLYRINAQSRALEEAMRREGLPYRIVGGIRFYERREVKDVLAYLRLITNPADDESFLRIVNVPRRGIGDASVGRLAEWASRQRVSLLAAAAQADQIPDIRGPGARALPELAALIQKHAALADSGVVLDELIRMLVQEVGFVDMLREEGPEAADRITNVEELIAGAADLQARLEAGDPELLPELEEIEGVPMRPVDLFLTHVALVADIDQHDTGADVVSLMTLHNAKGLEFPLVFVAGMEEGLFPLSRAYDEPAQLEEERRLFYVGITRAERKLYLTFARRRRRGAEWMDSVPSSFLESVPRELLDVRKSPQVRGRSFGVFRRATVSGSTRSERLGLAKIPPPAAAAPSSRYTIDYSDSQEPPRLVKGARVRHPQFGAGTVLELSERGANVRAAIDFDSVGRKTVVVRYANLQPEG